MIIKINFHRISNIIPAKAANEVQKEEKEEDGNILEERYERNVFKPAKNEKPIKYLLPVKTKEGLVKTQVTVVDDEEDIEQADKEKMVDQKEHSDSEDDIEMKVNKYLSVYFVRYVILIKN